jgi:hypothetical protein
MPSFYHHSLPNLLDRSGIFHNRRASGPSGLILHHLNRAPVRPAILAPPVEYYRRLSPDTNLSSSTLCRLEHGRESITTPRSRAEFPFRLGHGGGARDGRLPGLLLLAKLTGTDERKVRSSEKHSASLTS